MESVVDGLKDVLRILLIEFERFQDRRFESTVPSLDAHRDALEEVERRRLPNFHVRNLRKLSVGDRKETFLKRKTKKKTFYFQLKTKLNTSYSKVEQRIPSALCLFGFSLISFQFVKKISFDLFSAILVHISITHYIIFNFKILRCT